VVTSQSKLAGIANGELRSHEVSRLYMTATPRSVATKVTTPAGVTAEQPGWHLPTARRDAVVIDKLSYGSGPDDIIGDQLLVCVDQAPLLWLHMIEVVDGISCKPIRIACRDTSVGADLSKYTYPIDRYLR
jgi:hypothetical protein